MLPVAYLEKYAMGAFANVENQAAVLGMKKWIIVILETADVNAQKM